MKTLFKFFFTPLLWLLNSCSPLGEPVDAVKSDSYYFNNSKSDIQYSPMGNWFELQNTAMNADVESFEVLSRDLSRDKNRMYFEAYAVVNPNFDFSLLYVKNEEFMASTAFDKNNVYTFSKEFISKDSYEYKGIATIVEKADPLNFQRTDYDWAKDGTYHFYRNNSIAADYNSFEIINDNFAKDSSQTFIKVDSKFEAFKADLETFKTLNESHNAIDKNQVYWMSFIQDSESQLTVIPFSDINQVSYLNTFFLKVDNSVYFNGGVIDDAEAQTFEVVSYRYGKDAKHVYYGNKIIPNADLETFKISDKFGIQDKNGIYREGKLIDQ